MQKGVGRRATSREEDEGERNDQRSLPPPQRFRGMQEVRRSLDVLSHHGSSLHRPRRTIDGGAFVMHAEGAMRSTEHFTPRAWEVNPSGVVQRTTVVAISLMGLAAAIVCVLQARGEVGLWEPFPAIGPEGLLRSGAEPQSPVFHAIGFATVAITAAIGGRTRGLIRRGLVLTTAGAAAATAVSLIARWSVAYGHYGSTSTLFTIEAAASVATLPLVADELYATVAMREWRHVRQPRIEPVETQGWIGYASGIAGTLVGVWLLAAPLEGLRVRAVTYGHFLGATIAAIGVLSLSQSMRRARWINVLLGAWLAFAALFFDFSSQGMLHLLVAGLLLMVASAALQRSAPLTEA
jgi:hypothetical protein